MSSATASRRLNEALGALTEKDQHTPCQGKRAHRWTSDSHDDLDWAAFHCQSLRCPVLDLCGQAADEGRIKHHVWGGLVRTPKPRGKAA